MMITLMKATVDICLKHMNSLLTVAEISEMIQGGLDGKQRIEIYGQVRDDNGKQRERKMEGKWI